MKRFLGQEGGILLSPKALLQTDPPKGPSFGQVIHFLFLPVLQGTHSAKEFFGAAIRFLSQAHTAQAEPGNDSLAVAVSPAYVSAWADVRELWFLGMQALAGCVPLFPWLPQAVLQAGWLEGLSEFLTHIAPASMDFELIAAFQGVLVELARASKPCRDVILSHRGREWANLYGMAALEQCLSEQ